MMWRGQKQHQDAVMIPSEKAAISASVMKAGTFENASHNQLHLVQLHCRPPTKNDPTIRGSANGKGAATDLP